MSEISRNQLFGKLNLQMFRAAEAATVTCKLRGNPYVELVHWVHQILQDQDSDFRRIIKHYQLNPAALEKDVVAELDKLPRGATSIVDFSEHVDDAIERAWIYASLLFGDDVIRGGYLLLAILKTAPLRAVLHRMSTQFRALKPELLAEELAHIVQGSPEASQPASDGSGMAQAQPGEASRATGEGASGKGSALKKFAVDLTERARKGLLDPVTGRDAEIRQIIDILLRRRQNNPLLTGEAGVGKTAVVEGFAARVVSGEVPAALKDVSIHTLDVGLLQAGASMKGEFEQRLRHVIDEVQSHAGKVILFIDEVHTLVGAGGAQGTGDAANLLKPALARGNLRTIGATTWAEYKKYIEKDPALTRRFQVIQVHEPEEVSAIAMLRGITAPMEAHHKVLILESAIRAAVQLSHRYIPARQLPDKAVSLLDTACARVSLTQQAMPVQVEGIEREMQLLQTELDILQREHTIGFAHEQRMQEIAALMAQRTELLATQRARWRTEQELVEQIFDLRRQLNPSAVFDERVTISDAREALDVQPQEALTQLTSVSGIADDEEDLAVGSQQGEEVSSPDVADAQTLPDAQEGQLRAQLEAAQAALAKLQGEQPLVLAAVDEQAVATVVSEWTGIPVGRMVRNEIAAVLKLADTLGERVVGQDHSLNIIAERIQISRAQVEDVSKPIGVFLLVGPSGVGKTETALALAQSLYGGEHHLITINMSEFQEAHTVSTLKGAPPGYVGYGEGGVMTEAVRRKPYSVVLLDEVEKAHSDVHEIFFQVFDKGFMEDGEGRLINFKNTVIILTSNVGSDLITKLCADPELTPSAEALATAMREPLLKVFPAAFLGRLTVVPYFPLGQGMLARIVELKLRNIQKRLALNHQVGFEWTPAAIEAVISRSSHVESGARVIDAILSTQVLSGISREILTRLMNGNSLTTINLEGHESALRLHYQ